MGGEEIGDFVAATANAKGADGSFFHLVFEKMEEAIVLKVAGFDFVEEPEVDVVGAEGEEAAVERGFGLGGCEGGAFFVAGLWRRWLRLAEALLEAGKSCLRMGPAMRRPMV